MASKSKKLEEDLADLQAALEANLPAGGSLAIDGTSFAKADLIAILGNWRRQLRARAALREKYEDATEGCHKVMLDARVTADAVRSELNELLDPEAPEPPRQTPVQRYLAAAKGDITRDLRGTEPRRLKNAIASRRKPWAG